MKHLLLALALLVAGCQQHDYVTRAELRDLLAAPGVDQNLALSPYREADIAQLAAATFVAPPATAATSAAEAIATADRYTSRLAEAINAANRALEVCANNIANAETTAYKTTRAVRNADGTADFRLDFEQGSLQNTNRPLDLGISGNGFFRVKILDSIGDGFGYTRNGNFFVNAEGQLTLGMGDGYKLDPPIAIPQGVTEISISEGGAVEVLLPDQAGKSMVGQIQLAQFINPQGLSLLGGSIFTPTATSGDPIHSDPGENGAGVVLQAFLEASNVDVAKEYIRIRFLQNWRAVMLRAIDAH